MTGMQNENTEAQRCAMDFLHVLLALCIERSRATHVVHLRHAADRASPSRHRAPYLTTVEVSLDYAGVHLLTESALATATKAVADDPSG